MRQNQEATPARYTKVKPRQLALLTFVSPLLAPLPFPFQTALFAAVVAMAMTCLVMPRVSR